MPLHSKFVGEGNCISAVSLTHKIYYLLERAERMTFFDLAILCCSSTFKGKEVTGPGKEQ